jgi:hypothetical protein
MAAIPGCRGARPADESGRSAALAGETWRLPDGHLVNPGDLFTLTMESTPGELRRVNGERAITCMPVSIRIASPRARRWQRGGAAWAEIAPRHAGVSLQQGGELDDVKASLRDLLPFWCSALC